MKKKFLFLATALFTLSIVSYSQSEKNKIKFGNVTEADFSKKVYDIDTSASAVVIADIGTTNIEGNMKGWFSLSHKRFRRVHILNKNGYDAADVSVYLYTNGSAEEELDKLKAVTYNLENGKIVETKLEVKSNVFKDKLNKNLIIKKFTFPNIKEGSIIEYELTKTSDFLQNLEPWAFQGEYPCLWSEYNLGLPEFFGYAFLTQGFLKYDISDRKSGNMSYNITIPGGADANERVKLESALTDYRWVIKNVPALKEEAFTSTVRNYIQKIEFQLSEYKHPLNYKSHISTWAKFSHDMMSSEYFGEALTKENGWLNDITKPLVLGVSSKEEQAKRIFNWVRDNITCTDHSDAYLGQSLKNVLKTRNGTVSEVNLLLAALLRHEDIDTDPVLLSTRSNGFIYPLYPLESRFNYVVCRTRINNKEIFLDASEPRMGFGRLPTRCYNGQARVMDKWGSPIEMLADSLLERKSTTVFMINDDKGRMVGSMQQLPGYYESSSLRDRIKQKGQDELIKDIRKEFGMSIDITNPKIDSLDKVDYPILLTYDFDITEDKEDIIYFNPLFSEGYKDNPFKSAERLYPVEMPFKMDETYNLQMEIPAGYEVDELPKQMIVKLNEDDEGMFEYRVSHSGNNISLRSRITIKRATFMPDEYEMLREFFNMVVKKHSEQIVFKKKK